MTEQHRGSEPEPTEAGQETYEEEMRRRRGKWADEAAEARTADDPRTMAPHDRIGAPSTGDETL